MFDCYTKHLHKDLPWFWQRPKRGRLHYTDNIWYDKIRVGHEPIEDFMSRLSAKAQLSKRYTNHSIRSTVMGILSELYEGRHVIGLSGHKSENTIKHYARHLLDKKKREMSDLLNAEIQPAKQAKENPPNKAPAKFSFKPTTTSTISKPPDQPAMENAEEIPTENVNKAVVAPENKFLIEPLNEPDDDVLLQFLAKFDPITENLPPQENPPPLQPSNTMNINNVSNIQNVANQRMIPNMYFGGNSTVTINYNFSQNK